MIRKILSNTLRRNSADVSNAGSAQHHAQVEGSGAARAIAHGSIGLIAGYGKFPFRFVEGAKKHGCKVFAVGFVGDTDPAIERLVERMVWVKVGQLGKMIEAFKAAGVKHAVMAGGINRVRLFGGVKLDARGAAMLARLRSTKDDVIMRGVADELQREGVEILSCTTFLDHLLLEEGMFTKYRPTQAEYQDIEVGVQAIRSMSSQDIGQVVIVRDGVIVAVEAVEGTDAAILRGGELGGPGSVVVKFAKLTQDMRFDIPTVGRKTIETMIKARARVLALESKRCLLIDRDELIALADQNKIAIVACKSLIEDGR